MADRASAGGREVRNEDHAMTKQGADHDHVTEACRECGRPLTEAESAREGVYSHWCHACIQDAFADMASFGALVEGDSE